MTAAPAMTNDQLLAFVAKLQADNAALKLAAAAPQRALTLKVSEKGGVSVYGLGRFPVTLYAASWERLLDATQAKTILDFIKANAALVSRKG